MWYKMAIKKQELIEHCDKYPNSMLIWVLISIYKKDGKDGLLSTKDFLLYLCTKTDEKIKERLRIYEVE